MSSQAWTMLAPRALTPQAERLSTTSKAAHAKPKTTLEWAIDLWLKGRTVYGKSSGEGGGATLTAEDVKHALGGLADRPFQFGLAAFLEDAQAIRKVEAYLLEHLRWKADAGGWLRSRQDLERLERMAVLLRFETISARSRHETFSHQEKLPDGSAAVQCPQCNGKGAFGDSRQIEVWSRYRRLVARARRLEKLEPNPENGSLRKPSWKIHEALMVRARLEEAKALARICDLCEGSGRLIFTHIQRARVLGVSRSYWYRHWEERYADALEEPLRWEEVAISHVRRRLSTRA